MSDTRDNQPVSRVSVSPGAVDGSTNTRLTEQAQETSHLQESWTRDQKRTQRGNHSTKSDPRRLTVPSNGGARQVSEAEAGPRAQHQRRPVVEGSSVPKRRTRSSSVRELLLLILIPALIVVLGRVFVASNYVIPSGSMMDTLQVGDRIVTSKLSPGIFPLKRGDVIVFKDPAHWLGQESSDSGLFTSEYLVKRLIGLPGDHVQCCTAGGQLTINGTPIDETSYIRPGIAPSSITFDITVTKDHLFVLGDNRANSADSRYHSDDGANGLVPVSDVVGVAKFVYWPLNRFKYLSRPDSVFASVPEPTGENVQ